ncbi:MAG TPA: PEP-CTERM sorting domain-containing protein [Candidatus Acidoferrum sp.]|nr:PEP-CTERM sorting domain-containing protein [Candidatus Acidoferrum sp.]
MKIRNYLLTLALYSTIVPIVQATGLVNGDFELPVVPPSLPVGIVDYTTSSPPPASFGWQLASGALDLTAGTYWQPASGQQSLDMTGDWGSDPGVIYQDFTFSHAGAWAISFCLSANPDSPYPDFPTDRTLQVSFGTPGGSLSSLGTWTVSAIGRTRANMNWVTFTTPTINVQDSVVYRLEFSSLSPAPYGPVLDNVQLVSVPEPTVVALTVLGAVALLSGRRRR